MQRLTRRPTAQSTGPRWLQPLPLGVAYSVLQFTFIQMGGIPQLLGGGIMLPLALLGIIAWRRGDDHLASAVLFGGIVTLGGFAAFVVRQVVQDRALGGAILLIMSSLIVAFGVFLLMTAAGYVGVRLLRAFAAGASG